MLNVPTVSISRTVLKPFDDSFEAVARKFPAAPLISTSMLPNFFTVFSHTLLQSSIFLTSPGSEWQTPY